MNKRAIWRWALVCLPLSLPWTSGCSSDSTLHRADEANPRATDGNNPGSPNNPGSRDPQMAKDGGSPGTTEAGGNPSDPTGDDSGAAAADTSPVDAFGVKKIYPSIANGREWKSKWDAPRTFSGIDPNDPEFDADHGDATYKAGDGFLKVTGEVPRMYIHDPAKQKSWTNVEITTYGMRVADTNVSWAGIMAYARTNHGTNGNEDANLCDDRGYGGMVTYPGKVLFEKETAHHLDNGYAQVSQTTKWSGGMPKNQWIGYKFVVRDVDAGAHAKLEIYLDETDAANGGTWSKVIEFTDNGTNMGTRAGACHSGINPGVVLTSSDARPGSETGKPNLTVYFRSDEVGTDGLWYKKMSVREIAPLP